MTPRLHALIFDMDGTLVATDDHHFDAYVKVFGELGRTLTRDEYDRTMAGRPNLEILRDYFPDKDAPYHQNLADYKEQTFHEMSPEWETLQGLGELLSWARERGLKQALVTSAPRVMADKLLKEVGLYDYFVPEVYAAELPRGKPDPLPYRVALEHLGMRPEEAIVFEDALNGVRSAVAADIYTVGVATSQSDAALKDAGASLVIHDFTDPALWNLLHERVHSSA